MSKRRLSLVKQDALNMRRYFNEMLKRWGIDAMYYEVVENTKRYNETGEFSAVYKDPIPCQLIFDQVPKIATLKKLGWTTEIDESQPLVHISYDIPGIQVGACFSIADPINPSRGRLFRVSRMSMGIIYPSSITCQLVSVVGDMPENTLQPDTAIERNNENGRKIVRPKFMD